MNDSRKNRIEEFLKMLSRITFENPEDSLNENIVYSFLIDLGVQDKTLNKDELSEKCFANECRENQINYLFSYWINKFYHKKNTKCFVDFNWDYFCQFISSDVYYGRKGDIRESTHIKLYIPLDSKHIKDGANMIFDFLDQNNISHLSKIGSVIRFDDIVIRVFNESDARKIIKYINSNSYINEGLIKPNPFLYSENGIALAFDGELSCNSCLATIICEYIKNKKVSNGYNSSKPITFNDFYDFMLYMYVEIFNKDNKGKYTTDIFFEDYSEKKKSDLQGIFKTLLYCKENDYDISTYFAMFNSQKKLYDENNFSKKKLSDHEIEMLIIKGILILTKKFESEDSAYLNMFGYINYGDETYITTQDGLRNEYSKLNFSDCCRDFIQRKGTTIKDYLLILKRKLHEDYNIIVKGSYETPIEEKNYEEDLDYLNFLKDYYSGELMSGKKTSK